MSVVCVVLLHSSSSGLGIDKLSTSHCNLETLPQRAALSYNISRKTTLSHLWRLPLPSTHLPPSPSLFSHCDIVQL